MSRTLALRTQRFHIGKLDFTRISAEAGAIAINGAALLLLLAPLSMHVPPMEARNPDIVIIPATAKKPPPPIVDPPKKVEVVKQRFTPSLPAVTPQKPDVQPQPLVDPVIGDIAVDAVQLAGANIGRSDAITGPLAGAHLEYEVAPPPPYPAEAVRKALTGTVTLRVLVDVDGTPIDVQIERSSGHRVLDAAAKRQVLAKWKFRPAMDKGHAVQAIGMVPVVFNLTQ